MTTMADLRAAVMAAVRIAYSGPDGAVIWGRSDDVVCDPIVRLSVVSDREVTPLRETQTVDGEDLRIDLDQMRDVTFQVLLETENDGALDALPALRMGLWTQAARAEFVAIGAALMREFPDIREHMYRVDGRLVHAWSFDFTVRAVLGLSDPTPLGTITSVTIGQTVDGTDIGDITVNG